MAIELQAQGPRQGQFLRIELPEGQPLRFGRAPRQGWEILWEPEMSREHADVRLAAGRVSVGCVPTARNPFVYQGRPLRELTLAPGESFAIGQTWLRVVDLSPEVVPTDGPLSTREAETREVEAETGEAGTVLEERSYSAEELRRVGFANAGRQLELLSEIPRLIATSTSDEDTAVRLVGLLLEAIPQAEAVAVVHYDVSHLPEDVTSSVAFPRPVMMRVDTRDGFQGRFRPSRRLITKTLRDQESALQIWGGESAGAEFTISEGLGWAFSAPVRGESSSGWCLYVSGRGTRSGSLLVSEEDLKADLRFTELVAQFIGAIRQVRVLQEHKTQLSAFLSPKVIESVTGKGSREALRPSEQEITVLFCDVRGFSRKAEKLRNDLAKLLDSVSGALGVMADAILERDGTIADFQGDAALGFWGWPISLDEGPLPACRAALAIEGEFRSRNRDPEGLLEGFSVGLGIAHGTALAGQIGTSRQAKVGVFGPVVNQGARLEGMTRMFDVPIVVDETTAEFVRRLLPPSEGRLRWLARVIPKGMDTALNAYAVLPPADRCDDITEQMLADHQAAVAAIAEGRWDEAARLLACFPATDGPASFLKSFLEESGHRPPDDWTGAIPLRSKS